MLVLFLEIDLTLCLLPLPEFLLTDNEFIIFFFLFFGQDEFIIFKVNVIYILVHIHINMGL